jgi:DNA adenine methylase
VFARRDFATLAERPSRIRGVFLLSINDTPEIRETFRAFDLEEVSLTYTINGAAQQDARELIVSMRGLPTTPTTRDMFEG